jgi:rubrerythrin
MASNDELIEFIKHQIIIEKEIVTSLNKGLSNIKNPPVKAVLKGISLDSVKHSQLYSAASVLLAKVSPALRQENLDTQIELVEKHIQLEEDLIKKLGKIIPTIQNNKVKFLLNSVLSDEKRHHELLKQVLNIIVHGETITEDDWWKLLWENVPFHGAPGG